MIGRQEIYAIFALSLSIIDVMTLQQLRYIIAIDRHRNFARAAAELDITQPTLSSLLQKLENEIDVRILTARIKMLCRHQSGKRYCDRRKGP